jgi:hypothetical protein
MSNSTGSNVIVVTRHVGTVEYLRRKGLIGEQTKILVRAKPDDVRGKHVYGVIPIYLACYAEKVSMVTLDLPKEAQGRELTPDEVSKYCKGIRTFTVTEEK